MFTPRGAHDALHLWIESPSSWWTLQADTVVHGELFYPRLESMRERGQVWASGEGHAICVLLQMATSSEHLRGQLHLHVLRGQSSTGVFTVPRPAWFAVFKSVRPNSCRRVASPCPLEVVLVSETFLGFQCFGAGDLSHLLLLTARSGREDAHHGSLWMNERVSTRTAFLAVSPFCSPPLRIPRHRVVVAFAVYGIASGGKRKSSPKPVRNRLLHMQSCTLQYSSWR